MPAAADANHYHPPNWATPAVLAGYSVTTRLAAHPARPARVAPPPLVSAGV